MTQSDAPEPNPGVVEVLRKRPLKSATSVVFAAQRSNYRKHGLEEYANVDLDFLTKYAQPFTEAMVGKNLVRHLENQFQEFGIEPMNLHDLKNLKNISQIFDVSS